MRAKMVVEGIITGLHKSPYHGQSVEFADHRSYVPGDDIRHKDWKVYARNSRFVIKKFEEETNLRAHLLLDCSESMRFRFADASHKDAMTKYEYSATLAASLAYLLNRQLDGVGVTLFDSEVRDAIPVSTNRNVLTWIGETMDRMEPKEKSGMGAVFEQVADKIPRRGLVVVISDLFDDRSELERGLQAFTLRGHDLVVFHVLDRTEVEFPFEGNTLFRGLEEYPDVNADPRQLREAYLEVFGEYLGEVERICSGLAIDYRVTYTDEPLDAAIIAVIAARARVRRARR